MQISGSFKSFRGKPFLHLCRLISPVNDEVAPISAARQSGIPETSAVVTRRSIGRGCAALDHTSSSVSVTAADLLDGRLLPWQNVDHETKRRRFREVRWWFYSG